MKRKEVYEVIDGERDYQDAMTANDSRPDVIEDLHVGDTIAAIQYNLDKARDNWYNGAVPHEKSIEYLRKVAALCVYTGEIHGMPKRRF